MGYRVPIKAYGKLKKEQIQYMWVSEAGACEKCQALDGKIYNTADEIPDKPHPNCKCWIDLIENQDAITDPIEQIRAEKREEESVKLELLKLEGDIKCLEDECKIGIMQIREDIELLDNCEKFIQDKEIKQIREIKILLDESLELLNENSQSLDDTNNQLKNQEIEFTKLNTIDLLNFSSKLFKLKIQTNKTAESINKINRVVKDLPKKIKKDLETTLIRYLPQPLLDLGITKKGKALNAEDGAAFWLIASTKFENETVQNYINKNGYICDSISDIGDANIEKFVRKNLYKQVKSYDSRGVIYKQNSTISKAIIQSKEIKEFISKNKNKLLSTKKLENNSLEFANGNLFYAYHYANIYDIHLDKNNNLHAMVIDIYDFNEGESNELVKRGRKLQLDGKLEVYFNIAIIFIPYLEWINY